MTKTPAPRQVSGKQWRSLLEDPDTVARQYPVLAEMIGHPASRRRIGWSDMASAYVRASGTPLGEGHMS